MKRKLLGSLAIFCSVITFSACTKEETTTEGKINYQMEPTNLTASVGTTVSESGLVVNTNANSSLTWKAGRVIVHELDFEAKKDDREIEYKLTKPATVDLFKLSQEFGSITIPAGTYKEIKFELVLKKQTTANVFSISGIYKDETGKETNVEFLFNEDVNIKLEAENLTISSSEAYTGLLKLQLNKLVSQINSADLKSVDRNANGTIVISSTKNAILYNKIKAGFISFIKAEFKH
ncbi:hypothetical protein GZH53_18985 [Flavihumibacter sp. R14]|nr:hypothetical protein [Flavihumibacter soli]